MSHITLEYYGWYFYTAVAYLDHTCVDVVREGDIIDLRQNDAVFIVYSTKIRPNLA